MIPKLNHLAFEAKLEPIHLLREMEISPGEYEKRPAEINTAIGQAVTMESCEGSFVLGLVGNKYKVVQNQELYGALCTALKSQFNGHVDGRHQLDETILVERSSGSGSFSKAELSFPNIGADIRQLIGTKTHLQMKAGFVNTFDGSGKVRMHIGSTDLWCMNGSVVSETSKHVQMHRKGFDISKIEEWLEDATYKFWRQIDLWQMWANKVIDPDQVESLLNDAGFVGKRAKSMMEQIEHEFANRGQTVWAVYSAFTHYASHNDDRFTIRNSGKTDNEAVTLDSRNKDVTRLINTPRWQHVAAA